MSFEFLSLGYMQNGLLAALFVGAAGAASGVFIILRHIVFVSMVLAQLAVLGLSIAMYMQWSHLLEFAMAFAATLLGVVYLALFQNEQKAPPDAIFGMGYAACHAVSLLLLAKSSQGLEEVRHLMSGNLLSVTPQEVTILGFATAFLLLVHFLGHRSFVFVCADPEFAKVAGKNVQGWELLFYISLGFVISLSLQMTGIFYVFSCLIFPGMVGLMIGSNFASIQIISIIFSAIAAFLGVWLSFAQDFPTSEAIISVQAVLCFMIIALRASLGHLAKQKRFRLIRRIIRNQKIFSLLRRA